MIEGKTTSPGRVVLFNLLEMGADEQEVRQDELARRLRIGSSVGRVTDRLAWQGWITKTKTNDGKSHTLKLTAAGVYRLRPAMAQKKFLDTLRKNKTKSLSTKKAAVFPAGLIKHMKWEGKITEQNGRYKLMEG